MTDNTTDLDRLLISDEIVAEFEMQYLATLYPDRHDFAGSAPGNRHFEAYRSGLRVALESVFREKFCHVTEFPHPREPGQLRVRGVRRVADEPRALLVAFTDVPSDDELRAFHDYIWAYE